MSTISSTRRMGIVSLFLALGAIAPAQAQMPDLNLRANGGMTYPVGTFAEYFTPGPSLSFDVLHPLRPRMDLVLDLGLDKTNNQGGTYIPDATMWRYQLGIEADVWGRDDGIRVRPYLTAGAASFRSRRFSVGASNLQHSFSEIYPAGTAGIRFAVPTDQGLVWWLNGEFNWARANEADVHILRNAALREVEPFGAATYFGFSVGLSLP
jgi:hypothetical protein